MIERLRNALAAAIETPLSTDGTELHALPRDVDWLEVRADLVGDVDADWLRSRFAGTLLYSLRSFVEAAAVARPPPSAARASFAPPGATIWSSSRAIVTSSPRCWMPSAPMPGSSHGTDRQMDFARSRRASNVSPGPRPVSIGSCQRSSGVVTSSLR
jgi:hypothetical protein